MLGSVVVLLVIGITAGCSRNDAPDDSADGPGRRDRTSTPTSAVPAGTHSTGCGTDQVTAGYCVDLDRVHLTGMSLGAWKAAATACAHADRFASIALVTVEVHPSDCPPMSVVAFHGTADTVVPYGEGADPGVVVTGPNAGLPGARGNIAEWASAAGCGAEPLVQQIGTDVEHWRYPGCPDGRGVEFYSIEGGGHTWPGASIDIGPTTQTIDSTDIALDWFETHPRA